MKRILYWICLFGLFTSCRHLIEVEPPEPTDYASLMAGDYRVETVLYFNSDITKYYTGSLHIDRITADSVKANYLLNWTRGDGSPTQDQSFIETISLEAKPDQSVITRGHPLSGSALGGTFGQYKDGQLTISTVDATLHLTFKK